MRGRLKAAILAFGPITALATAACTAQGAHQVGVMGQRDNGSMMGRMDHAAMMNNPEMVEHMSGMMAECLGRMAQTSPKQEVEPPRQ
jgi:threonine dehydrogenase-like Zn-dependent dehydrogenase